MPDFLPNQRRARAAVIILWIIMLADIISILASFQEGSLYEKQIAGAEVPEEQIQSAHLFTQKINSIQIIVAITSAFFFIRWFYRAYYNLHLIGLPHIKLKAGWAIGCWFVPILNLYRPYTIMDEIWRGTEALTQGDFSENWRTRNAGGLVAGWWTTFIITSAFSNIAGTKLVNAEGAVAYLNAIHTDMASEAVHLIAAFVALNLIKKVAMMEKRVYGLLIDRADRKEEPGNKDWGNLESRD